MKKCCKCRETKDNSEFYKNRRRTDGLQTYCKTCSNKRRKKYYKENKQQEDQRNKARQSKVQEFVRNYKEERGCSNCIETRWYVLQFHHRDREEKEINVSALVRHGNIEQLKEEIAKCDILCANCHIAHHYEHNNQWK